MDIEIVVGQVWVSRVTGEHWLVEKLKPKVRPTVVYVRGIKVNGQPDTKKRTMVTCSRFKEQFRIKEESQ